MIPIKVICLYYLNIVLLRIKFNKFLPKKPSIIDREKYSEWRMQSVEKEIRIMESLGLSLKGKIVMDFGCGEGGKLIKLYELNPFKLIGVDIDSSSLEYAETLISSRLSSPTNIELIKATSTKIPLSSSSVDIIICLDVLEHISHLNSVVTEWYRILKSSGKIFFKYQPNESPYGHHADRFIVLPWIQYILSKEEMDSLFNRTKVYWKKSNNNSDSLAVLPFINKLKVHEILRTFRNYGFKIDNFDLTPFEGNTNKWARMLSRIVFLFSKFRPYFSCRAAGILVKSE